MLDQILIEELDAVQSNDEVGVATDALNFAQDLYMLFEAMLPKIEREGRQQFIALQAAG